MNAPELYISRISAAVAATKALALGLAAETQIEHMTHRNEQGFAVRLFDWNGRHLGVLGEDWRSKVQAKAPTVELVAG